MYKLTTHFAQRFTVLIALTLLVSCASNDINNSVSAEQLAKQLTASESLLIIDSRSQSEYDAGHIAGALHVPFWQAYFADEKIIKRCQNETAIIYCEHGPRASIAEFSLKLAGCKSMLTLDGHLSGWRSKGLPLSTSHFPEKLTKDSHGN